MTSKIYTRDLSISQTSHKAHTSDAANDFSGQYAVEYILFNPGQK